MAKLETKAFPALWAQLSEVQRGDLKLLLLTGRCTTTTQSIYNWAAGKTSPAPQMVRDAVARIVGEYLGVKLYSHILFPPKKK